MNTVSIICFLDISLSKTKLQEEIRLKQERLQTGLFANTLPHVYYSLGILHFMYIANPNFSIKLLKLLKSRINSWGYSSNFFSISLTSSQYMPICQLKHLQWLHRSGSYLCSLFFAAGGFSLRLSDINCRGANYTILCLNMFKKKHTFSYHKQSWNDFEWVNLYYCSYIGTGLTVAFCSLFMILCNGLIILEIRGIQTYC